MRNRFTWILLLASAMLATVSCNKENEPSGRELLGVWVDVDHRSDTLVITRESGGVVLFDNSMAYRTHPRSAEIRNHYRWFITIDKDEIGVSWFDQSSIIKDYVFYPFTWLERKNKFEIESLTFRPYISCLGCKLQFERIR